MALSKSYSALTLKELLNVADRADPITAELCERLENIRAVQLDLFEGVENVGLNKKETTREFKS